MTDVEKCEKEARQARINLAKEEAKFAAWRAERPANGAHAEALDAWIKRIGVWRHKSRHADRELARARRHEARR